MPLFFCSLYVFVVCVFALFFCICPFFFFPPSSFFFFYLCVPLSIYREIPKKLSLFFSQLIRSWRSFHQFFSSTTPNFMFSRDPLFSLFLFYLFCCFLSSFFLVCDSPTFRLLRPNFIKPCSLLSGDATSLFTFQLFYFILLDLFLSISYVLGSRPLTWLLFLFS